MTFSTTMPNLLRRAAQTASLLALVGLVGCATKPVEHADYTRFIDEHPKSILVVPVVNNSPEVGAADYFLATITVPLAERGYYVFPVNLSKVLLADVGLSDPGLVAQADPVRLAKLFGADSVLYIEINDWESKYILISTTVTVSFHYTLRSGRTGELLWEKFAAVNYTPRAPSTGNAIADLAVMVTQAAITKMRPNYMPLARQANWAAINSVHVGQGQPTMALKDPMLFGPYHELHRSDWQTGEAAPTPAATPEKAAEPEKSAKPVK